MNHRRQIDTRDGGPLPTSTTRTNQQSETQELPRQPSSLPQSMPHAGANSIQQLSFRRFNDNPNLTNHGVLQQGSQQPMTSYMTLQRPSQLQFLRPEQESSEQSMSTTMMTQPYSAGIRSFVGPSRLGHESQPFNICKSIPFPTANTAAVSQLVTGSSVFPCKSRGMTKDHNPQTAYFVVPKNAKHGLELRCSHPACQKKGIRFVYCKVCNVPVAKINFTTRHKHDPTKKSTSASGEDIHSGDKKVKASTTRSQVRQSSGPARKRARTGSNEAGGVARLISLEPDSQQGKNSKENLGMGCVDEQITNAFSSTSSPARMQLAAGLTHQNDNKQRGDQLQQQLPQPHDCSISRTEERQGYGPMVGMTVTCKSASDSGSIATRSMINRKDLGDRERQWLELLHAKPDTDDESKMKEWYVKLTMLSDHRQHQPRPVISDDGSKSCGSGDSCADAVDGSEKDNFADENDKSRQSNDSNDGRGGGDDDDVETDDNDTTATDLTAWLKVFGNDEMVDNSYVLTEQTFTNQFWL